MESSKTENQDGENNDSICCCLAHSLQAKFNRGMHESKRKEEAEALYCGRYPASFQRNTKTIIWKLCFLKLRKPWSTVVISDYHHLKRLLVSCYLIMLL